MNKEELLKKYDEKAKALRDEFISKLGEVEKKPFEVKLPNKYDTLYFFDFVDNEIYMTGFNLHEKDIARFLYGCYFKTREEVEQYMKERKLLFKLHQWAKEKNDGWEPDWENGKIKFYLWYDSEVEELKVDYTYWCDRFNKLPYFKSQEIVLECIDLFGEEIIEVLC